MPPLRSPSALQSLRSLAGIPLYPLKGAPERDIFLLVLSVGVGVWRGVLFSLSLKDSLHFWRQKVQHIKIHYFNMPGGSCRFVFTINNYTDEDIDYLENTDLFHYVCYGRELERISPLIYKDISNSSMVIENHFQLAFLHLEKTVVLVSLI